VYEALEREPKLWTYLVSYYLSTKQSEILMNCWLMFVQDIKVTEVSQIKRLNPDITSEAFTAKLDAINFNRTAYDVIQLPNIAKQVVWFFKQHLRL